MLQLLVLALTVALTQDTTPSSPAAIPRSLEKPTTDDITQWQQDP